MVLYKLEDIIQLGEKRPIKEKEKTRPEVIKALNKVGMKTRKPRTFRNSLL